MSAPEPDWIEVPGGFGWMGGGPRAEENPRHRVRITPFRLARCQVTRSDYQSFVDATGHETADSWNAPEFSHPRSPAIAISWNDATAYCAWISTIWAETARLPSEAEWEWAAKARRDVTYPWGDNPPETLPDYDKRWLHGPEPVDAYASLHPLGFLGLGENVHEWCSDWFDLDYYQVSPVHDPRGPEKGRRRSSRGGAWRHAVKVSRCAARSSIPPHMRYTDYGFRLAADAM